MYFLWQTPFTMLAHIVGGYIGGHFAPRREMTTAALGCFILVASYLILIANIPSLEQDILVEYGGGATYLTYLIAGFVEAGPGFLFGALLSKSVSHFREARVFDPKAFDKKSRILVALGGLLAMIYGLILGVSVFLVFLYHYMSKDFAQGSLITDITDLIRLTIIVGTGTLSGYIFKYGKRLKRTGEDFDKVESDVLILRSFSDDEIELEKKSLVKLLKFYPLNYILPVFFEMSFFAVVIEEFKSIGNVVLLGDPREDLPKTAASRPYFSVSTEEWKAYVRDCMDRAKLIAILPGVTKGLF
jgi:hypothetical protein